MALRLVAGGMALVLLLCAAVQYNDPDPIRWMLIYGASGLVSAGVALGRRVTPWAPAVMAATAAAWSLSIVPRVVGRVAFADLWREFEMKSPLIEEAREATGLAITAAWMLVVAVALARRRSRT